VAKKLLLIDGNSLLHRAFHALPQSLSTSTGQPTNAIYGLAQMLLPLLADDAPDAALVAFDAPGKTFRDELFEDYKAGRPPTDETLIAQFDLAHELIDALGMAQTEIAGYEADDIIGTVAEKASAAGFDVLIITGDRDVLQLVDDQISVLATIRGLSETQLYKPDEVEEEYGVRPNQIADYKALAGDSSDNIPGVAGVGPKTAAQLLEQFADVEELLERLDEVDNKKLAARLKESTYEIQLSKRLATIALDSPLELGIADLPSAFCPAGILPPDGPAARSINQRRGAAGTSRAR
jgi:DNA polymerase-1